MLSTFIFVIFICVLFSILFYVLDPKRLKLYKLKKIICHEYDTKVKFSYKTKLMGTDLYIFTDNSNAYTISEFEDICGKQHIK